MRNNQPITDDEYEIPAGVTLVSKTDLHGTITECNDAFEAASGFKRDELLGEPHNLVRHPDIPSVVFKDMWETLSSGIPWSQIVKNRRKDGGFYWVKAHATPIFEKDNIIGFMSVRSPVTDSEKQLATSIYHDLENGKAIIRNGKVSKPYSLQRFIPSLSLGTKILLTVITFGMIPSLLTFFELIPKSWELASVTLMALLTTLFVGIEKFQMKKMTSFLKSLSSGQTNNKIDYDPKTPRGRLCAAIDSASLAFNERVEENAYQLDKAKQLQLALDKVQSNIMMTDSDYNIIYVNDALRTFLEERETKLQAVLPQLDAKNIVGANIDVFHKNPSHNRGILDSLKEPFSAEIDLAGYAFELQMRPLFNRSGTRTGVLVEWLDCTQEKQLMGSVKKTVELAQQGYLSSRIDLSQVEGVAKELSLQINNLMETIQGSLNQIITVTSALSEGELNNQIENSFEGELGELTNSINVSISQLSSTVAQSINTSNSVSQGTEELSDGAMDLSDRVQEQAASVEETSATMEQMAASIEQNFESIRDAKQKSILIQEKAETGSVTMQSMLNSMSEIQESSENIAEIVNLIDSIAFQTNLLALNAAVEAARAGEHGKGFAVVAGEVRTLAQKSADAAKDIKELVTQTTERVNEGASQAENSGKALGEIKLEIDQMSSQIEGIDRSTQEQSKSISEINQAMARIDSVTQQNAALVEQTTAATAAMKDQTQELKERLSFFKASEQAYKNRRLAKQATQEMETSPAIADFDVA